jgi:dihydroorotase/N-acyl-D-amino-acid deacylase
LAHLVLVLTLLIWSFSFLAAARLRQDLGLVEAVGARFLPVLLGAGVLLLWRRPLRLPRAAFWRVAAMGLLGVPVYNLAFLHGLKSVPSGTAALVIAMNPVFTAVLARLFLREAFGLRRAAGLALALAGVFVVIRFGTDRPVDWPYLSSALVLVLAPLSWAVYTVIGRGLPAAADAFDTTYALLFIGSLPLLALASPALGRRLLAHQGALGAALYLAVPCTLVAYASWIWALKRLPAGEVAAFVFLNPPLANLWAWLFEGATLKAPFLLGAAVLLAGVAAIVLPLPRPGRPRGFGGSRMRTLRAALACATLAPFAPIAHCLDFDLVIRNGRVVDGTGAPWFRADVAVKRDTIVAVRPRIEDSAGRTIDADGRVVAPGFIDVHTHARRGIFEVPTAENYVRQGVTTLVEGQDGSSPLPLGELLSRVEALRPAVNFASLVGHGSVREAVVGSCSRAPSAAELARMQELVHEAMRDGAFGLSTGLFYVPGTFARAEEVIALARAAGEMGGIHVSHIRDEAAGVLESVRETIAIGEEGRLPTQVTHHKLIGRASWGRSVDTLRMLEEARRRGVDATVDLYPYTASSTALAAALFPAWALEGGAEAIGQRLSSPDTRARIRGVVAGKIRDERGGGDPGNIRIAACGFDPSLEGKTLAEILAGRGLWPTVENAADLALEIVERGGASAVFRAIAEEDVERILASPLAMVASDGEIPVFGRGVPHPRSYGTFARVLGVYVREKRLLGLEEAVRKMTAFPAARLGLPDRGLVRPGMKADLVVFDPATIRDRATFEKPHQYAEGVGLVVVNGEVVLAGERMTGVRPGRVLRGPAFVGPAVAY